jgi:hypothetical protein
MIDKYSLRFNRYKMINSEKSELYTKKLREHKRGATILLLLRRPLWDAVTSCALEKVGTHDSQEEVPGTTIALREKELI